MTSGVVLPDWARTVLARIVDPPGEAALLDVVREAVHQLTVLLPGSAPDRFAGLIAFCGAALASMPQASPIVRRKLLEVRGVAEAQTFEQTGDMAALRQSVADLGMAVGEGTGDDNPGASANLAQALFRLGEQTGDLTLLRASIDRFRTLPPEHANEPIAQSTCSVAAMTIGGLSGDRQMVERAILDLQRLIQQPGLPASATAVIEQNLAMALLKNAEQSRSSRVYSEVLAHLQDRLSDRRRTPEAEMLRLVQVMARFQFAKIAGDPRALRKTELELSRLLRVFAREPRRRLELLHLLGQARFQRAQATRSVELTALAITSLRQALELCTDAAGRPDARRDRLLADLGYYLLQSGLLSSSPAQMHEAQQMFETALHRIKLERAPGLYIQVAKGLFELHYRQNAYGPAAAVAADIDRAARLARTDPRLTAGVLAQAPLDVVGLAERHALCLVRLGQLTEASLVLDSARGQMLAAALERSSALEAELAPEALKALAAARVDLTVRLQSADDVAVRRAWEDYLTLRRTHRLDLSPAPREARRIAAAVPIDGAFVQLNLTPAGSFGLVWTQQLEEPILVTLPQEAWRAVRSILHGPPSEQAWITAYQRFLDDSEYNDLQAQRAASQWAEVVDECLRSLWKAIFEPLEAALHSFALRLHAPLVICPQGELALLPLSAALMPTGGALSDRWDVSIVPNVLAATRKQPVGGWTRAQFACLHSPADDLANELPLANDEAAAVRRSMSQMIEVCGNRLDATTALAAMKEATHLHVACHGEYDANDASRSGLRLARGERLTLTRLWAAGVDGFAMRLVFLSCCEGGMTGRSLDSDEFAGLPAAFLQLGAHGVIAAQWAVHDDAARVFADAFYRRYLDADGAPCTTPARALGETRRWMRSVTVATLINENYLQQAQAEELFDEGRAMVGTSAPARNSMLEAKPYAPACHWAGWTLFGR